MKAARKCEGGRRAVRPSAISRRDEVMPAGVGAYRSLPNFRGSVEYWREVRRLAIYFSTPRLTDLPTRVLALSLEECQASAYNTSRTSWLELAGGPVPRRLRESVRLEEANMATTQSNGTEVAAKLRPLGDRVVVRPSGREETTKSGIVIPDTAKEKPQRGTVDRGRRGPPRRGRRSHPDGCRGRERVLFAKYAGTEFKLEDEEYSDPLREGHPGDRRRTNEPRRQRLLADQWRITEHGQDS